MVHLIKQLIVVLHIYKGYGYVKGFIGWTSDFPQDAKDLRCEFHYRQERIRAMT